MISPGVCNRLNTGKTMLSPAINNKTALAADSPTALPTTFFSLFTLPAPNSCAIRIENPCANPWIIPSIIQFSQSAAPNAAKALTPNTCPTTMVSTTVYSCWNTFPIIKGSAKEKINFIGFPSVITFMFAAIYLIPPLFFCNCINVTVQPFGFPVTEFSPHIGVYFPA